MRLIPTTSQDDQVGRLMMLGKPLAPAARCDELQHPRATIRRDGTQWIVTIWAAPFEIAETPGAVSNHGDFRDASAWADLKVGAERMSAGQFVYRKEARRGRKVA